MNRSILIVICDFLLVSLLAFSNLETMFDDKSEQTVMTPPKPRSMEDEGKQDMVSALKLALDDERQTREQLASELARSRQSAEAAQGLLAEREQLLSDKESRIREVQDSLKRTEAQTRELDEQRAQLRQQIDTSQTNAKLLETALTATRSEADLTKEQLQELREDLRRRQQEAQALQQKLANLEQSHSNVLTEKQQLFTKLQVAETEKRFATEQLVAAKTEVQAAKAEVQVVRTEKAQLQATTAVLAQGVNELAEKSTQLAEKSTQLTQEIREHRPLAPNTIFSEFTSNKVDAFFEGVRSGAVGQGVRKEKIARSILITDTNQTYLVFHVADTLLSLWPPGNEWHSLNGIVARGLTSYDVSQISFLAQDPRILVMPVGQEQARQLGAKVYQLANDPFRFPEAVVVGANEGYYGECKFQIDLSTPNYLKMDRNVVRGMFGKFNPGRGDFVFSKSGELIGVMVNNEYCAVLNKISAQATIRCGDDLKGQPPVGQTVSQLQQRVAGMPPKLQ